MYPVPQWYHIWQNVLGGTRLHTTTCANQPAAIFVSARIKLVLSYIQAFYTSLSHFSNCECICFLNKSCFLWVYMWTALSSILTCINYEFLASFLLLLGPRIISPAKSAYDHSKFEGQGCLVGLCDRSVMIFTLNILQFRILHFADCLHVCVCCIKCHTLEVSIVIYLVSGYSEGW